jgi:hypothetical protein
MLREITWVSQVDGEPRRRWFCDHDIDLIVWQEAGNVVGFQLCYGKTRSEQALSWQSTGGYTHSRVDAGDCRPGRHKATPILVPGGDFDAFRVAGDFLLKSIAIEPSISAFVYAKLLEYKSANTFALAE